MKGPHVRFGWPTASGSAVCLGLALVAAACGKDAGGWRGTVEKRADGVEIVRNPEQGEWGDHAPRLVEDLRLGSAEAEGPTLFGEVAAVEVDPLGRIWVLERHAKELRVFGPDGAHVRTIGRQGAGPGEFRDPIGLAWAPDGTLWVADPGNARFTVFDTAGALVGSRARRVGGYAMPWRGGFGPGGSMCEVVTVVRGQEPELAVVRFDTAVQPVDTFPLPPQRTAQFELRSANGFIAAAVPFTPGLVMALDPRGFLWTGLNDRYRFVQHRLEGDTVRIVERQAAPVPVSAAERDQAVAGMKWFTDQGGRVDPGRIPGTKPAYTQIIPAAGGSTWVRPALPAGETGTAFDVFDAAGRYQGRVRLPGGMDAFPIPIHRGGALYGVASDSLDVPYVVRARIVRRR